MSTLRQPSGSWGGAAYLWTLARLPLLITASRPQMKEEPGNGNRRTEPTRDPEANPFFGTVAHLDQQREPGPEPIDPATPHTDRNSAIPCWLMSSDRRRRFATLTKSGQGKRLRVGTWQAAVEIMARFEAT